MTVALDQALCIGGTTIAALARRSIRRQGAGTLSLQAAKHPVAILVRRDGVTTALDIGGSRIAMNDVDERFPGQRAAFEKIASDDRGTAR